MNHVVDVIFSSEAVKGGIGGIGICAFLLCMVTLRRIESRHPQRPQQQQQQTHPPAPETTSDNGTGHHGGVGILRHLKAIGTLPFNVTVTVPILLRVFVDHSRTPEFVGIARQHQQLSFPWNVLYGSCTCGLFLGGSALFIRTNRLFHSASGTLAPWDPPKRFVVQGPYRYVRNPMLSGVHMILLAECMLLKSRSLVGFTCTFFFFNTVYFMTKEEMELQQRYGHEYDQYRTHVPRWIPRLTPYTMTTNNNKNNKNKNNAKDDDNDSATEHKQRHDRDRNKDE